MRGGVNLFGFIAFALLACLSVAFDGVWRVNVALYGFVAGMNLAFFIAIRMDSRP